MELFTHINEMGSEGWESLRTIVLICSRAVLWAPSASRMALYRHRNRLLPTPSEVLWYVEKEHSKSWPVNGGSLTGRSARR